VHNPAGGWDVKRAQRPRVGHLDTKQEAIDVGREISRKQHTELRIHTWTAESPRATATAAIPSAEGLMFRREG